ncbi:hypothetical protein C8R46DRAFT_1238354 [Mycena filopes]|nr:hypothetical protein C8R46DRAFT_1238354 [Mycena filopes]
MGAQAALGSLGCSRASGSWRAGMRWLQVGGSQERLLPVPTSVCCRTRACRALDGYTFGLPEQIRLEVSALTSFLRRPSALSSSPPPPPPSSPPLLCCPRGSLMHLASPRLEYAKYSVGAQLVGTRTLCSVVAVSSSSRRGRTFASPAPSSLASLARASERGEGYSGHVRSSVVLALCCVQRRRWLIVVEPGVSIALASSSCTLPCLLIPGAGIVCIIIVFSSSWMYGTCGEGAWSHLRLVSCASIVSLLRRSQVWSAGASGRHAIAMSMRSQSIGRRTAADECASGAQHRLRLVVVDVRERARHPSGDVIFLPRMMLLWAQVRNTDNARTPFVLSRFVGIEHDIPAPVWRR